MGLESASFISALNALNPEATDARSQGDDHLRLIKAVLQSTFPNASRAFRFLNSLAAQTSNYNVVAASCDNLVIPVNASSAGVTVTLPATPGTDGLKVYVIKTDPTGNAVTISGNGNSINASSSLILNSQYQHVMLVWCASAGVWIAVGGVQSTLVGEIKAYSGTTAPGGWVLCNAQTIGNASSSATARAAADTEALFRHLWASYSNTVCPVSSGRGASAAADFAAGKSIGLPDLRGRSLFGLDTMGNSAAGRLGSIITGSTNGNSGGAETVTIAQANLPNVLLTFSGTTSTDGIHTHSVPVGYNGGGGENGSNNPEPTSSSTTGSSGSHNHTVSGNTSSLNGGVTQTAMNNLPPAFLVSWIMKL